jgi:hypothetical protein
MSSNIYQINILKKLHEDGKLKLLPEYIENTNFDLNLTANDINLSPSNAASL